MAHVGLGAAAMAASGVSSAADAKQPNILYALADDWSWPHASFAHELGVPGSDTVVQTPAFDRIRLAMSVAVIALTYFWNS